MFLCLFAVGLRYRPARMMQCFHFMVEPAKNFTAKIKVTTTEENIVCLICKPVFLGHCDSYR